MLLLLQTLFCLIGLLTCSLGSNWADLVTGLVTHWSSSPRMPKDVLYTSKSSNQIAQGLGAIHLVANFSGVRYLSGILFSPIARPSITTVHS